MNHLYEIATGRLISSTSLPIDSPPEGVAVKVSDKKGVWNTETLDFDPIETPDWGQRFDVIDFLRLFTTAERVGIRVAAKSDPVVEDFMAMMDAATAIWQGHPDTVAGINYLVSQGLLTAGRGVEVLGG